MITQKDIEYYQTIADDKFEDLSVEEKSKKVEEWKSKTGFGYYVR